MDKRFVEHAQNAWDGQVKRRARNQPVIDLEVQERESDASVCARLMEIVNNFEFSPERRIQRASILLNNTITAKRILMDVAPGSATPHTNDSRESLEMRPPKGAGAAVVYLTPLDYMSAFDKKLADNEKNVSGKQKKRNERAENKKR